MGRQLPILATPEDERELLRFIQTLSAIRVFRTFAPTPDLLWLDNWMDCDIEEFGFNVWLQLFPWEPTYSLTGGPNCPPDRSGKYYVSNSGTAPVIEISRPPRGSRDGGRIYWARNFSAPYGLTYDADAFSKCVDHIWRWIRKHGKRDKGGLADYRPYVLPRARKEPAT